MLISFIKGLINLSIQGRVKCAKFSVGQRSQLASPISIDQPNIQDLEQLSDAQPEFSVATSALYDDPKDDSTIRAGEIQESGLRDFR